MSGKERLQALQSVREAKDAVNEALSLAHRAAQADPLQALENCLEKIEGILIEDALDAKISELQHSRRQLIVINSEISVQVDNLKSVASKVEIVAKALSTVIEIVGKAATIV